MLQYSIREAHSYKPKVIYKVKSEKICAIKKDYILLKNDKNDFFSRVVKMPCVGYVPDD